MAVKKPGAGAPKRRRPRPIEIEQPEREVFEQDVPPDLEEAVLELVTRKNRLKDETARLTQEAQDQEALVLDLLMKAGLTTVDFASVKATAVQGATTSIDWDSIESMLTNAEWDAVTKRVGDRDALDRFLKKLPANSGMAKRIAGATSTKPSKPYVRLTQRTQESTDAE